MDEYESLLDKVTKNVQKRMETIGGKKIKGTDFEQIVYEELLGAGIDEEKISHSVRRFPDFIIEDETTQIGVEVKKTDSDKWDVPGGSVYESLRNTIAETFVLMGKFGGIPEARIRKYGECISNLTVTHSPRFHLKLDLPQGEDYLTKNNASDLLDFPEGKELNRRIRELLRTDKSTWYSEEAIESFFELEPDEKQKFFVDGVVLFPEVTGGNYSNFAPWMTYKCLVWCSNVRDVFSAGGTKDLGEFIASAVMGRILEKIDLIINRISEMTPQELQKHWGVEKDMRHSERVEKWISLIDRNISVSKELKKVNKEKYPDFFKWKRKNSYGSIIKERFMLKLRERIISLQQND